MQIKNALHINSYFLTNEIHYNFYRELLKHREDFFLIPVYKKFRKGRRLEGVEVDYVYNEVDSTLFFTKLIKIFYLIYKKRLNTGYSYIHAHTLMSDGVAAYALSCLLNKKLVITVRATDLNFFIARSALFRYIAKKILAKATLVFLVSPPHGQQLETTFPGLIRNKICFLPNGLDEFWLQNIYSKKIVSPPHKTVNLLYVGEIIERKQLKMLIDFIRIYTDRRYILTVVGKNTLRLDFDYISKSIQNGNAVNYLGEIREKEKLLQVYRENDIFALLSYGETFGVVYLEALSQGLPILYTKGDGIDGYFEDGKVGYACDYRSIKELKQKVDLTIEQYISICANTTKSIEHYDWTSLVKQYIKRIDHHIHA